ncbi:MULTISPECIES: carboxymuconolactone decarboxylase family protein [unclassified Micromonospora]|uniref:carboxymuconolactone decarboxylase family protein n=1 Tax=unclassified Micromonospora TaxID=2617518 RepID=UPI001B3994CC|nr:MULTISPECIES: carboxymuconolactone decarboxylase family protein [unclassified Micromonospora]MBQ1041033.1 carboxymuconolactone decarboxylase family protein [Micromonospora sp. C72]MBQ1055166.1 carboxymuconolactone decarboxylase family protein [Micromonospora sp. C32]
MSVDRTLADRYLGGRWTPAFDAIAAEAPQVLEAYLRLAAVPWRGRELPVALKELICVALSAAPGHLYPAGVRMHVAGALRAGAPRAHVMHAAAVAGSVGIRAATLALPILADLAGPAVDGDAGPPPVGTGLAAAHAEVVDAGGAAGLPAVDRELIAVAVAAAVTLADADVVREHIRTALDLGATAGQVAEAVALACGIGLHGCLLVADELAAAAP